MTLDDPEEYEPRDKPYEVHDESEPGLLLRIQPSSYRCWYFTSVDGATGKKNRVRIGPADEVTLEKARRIARRQRDRN